MTVRAPHEATLEEALARLDEIAALLEGEEIELAESLALYEEGVTLVRWADGLLASAESRLQQLRPDGATYRLDAMEDE